MIKDLQINNYKSINQVNLECNRINVLVGRPNVGKSNIIEALDLTYIPSFFGMNEANEKQGYDKIDLKEYFRVRNVRDLFHLGNTASPISVIHSGFSYDFSIEFKDTSPWYFEWIKSDGQFTRFNDDFVPEKGTGYYGSPVYPYKYKKYAGFHKSSFINKLMPPFGNNLVEVIQNNPPFRDFIAELAKDNGFEFNVNAASDELLIQFRIRKGVVYTLPFEALADTLKRLIFYIAAIRYNNAHVITLEEPEVHSFPPFVSYLGDEIIKAEGSQFFIVTHSPYLLNNLIENTPSGDLAVFVCGYDSNKLETTVKKLSEDDLSELLNYGVDIFFNINRYTDERVEDNS